ncbi:triosephosphate isomerase [Nowakowskiella sp. JEL0407]|nr:triosephosphate isomerase [Nowakowskiella sp. JEL0407]
MGSILSKGKKNESKKEVTPPMVQVTPDTMAVLPVEKPKSDAPVKQDDQKEQKGKEKVEQPQPQPAKVESSNKEAKEPVKLPDESTSKAADPVVAVVQVKSEETKVEEKTSYAKTRRFLVGGNWKMNGSKSLIDKITEALNGESWAETTDVFIAPPSVYWSYTRGKAKKEIAIGAQNIFYEKSGAFTGELSVEMMKDLNVDWAIIGHSERRNIFKETNEIIAKKAAYATNNGINVIVNIGESLSEREDGKWKDVIFEQLKSLVDGGVKDWSKVVLAYEPVWAIGTGKVATASQAQESLSVIRKWINDNVSSQVANEIRILYTGSVNPSNCGELSQCADCDGFIVGGAALNASDLVAIIKSRS